MSHGETADTHEVFNQPAPLEDYDLFSADRALVDAVVREGGGWAQARLAELGRLYGGRELLELGFQANESPPRLRTHDRYGHRVDRVAYHPAYHRLLRTAIEYGLHAAPWVEPRRGAHVARAAMFYIHNQIEAGTSCPLTMTFAASAALQHAPDLQAQWSPKLHAFHYDGEDRPAREKRGVTMGMAMTEKQGGSDVRANTTRARPVDAGRGVFEIVGHKWFCSAPMSDAFLILARTDAGSSCFLLPRWREDGRKNRFEIQRLKSKLGNRSNASSEVEFRGAQAFLVGEEGRGIPTILEMVALTRFDCILGSASLMRQAVAQACYHVAQRRAFGKLLVDQPLMRNVVADLAVESEASLVVALRIARALDSLDRPEERALFRIATALGKFWICKRTPALVNEAQECLGGLGYVEESILPRLYREAPLNSIWEGSGNVQCLDMLRTMRKQPEAVEALFVELDASRGLDERYDRNLEETKSLLGGRHPDESHARRLAEALARCLQAALLLRADEPRVASAYCESRLEQPGAVFGRLTGSANDQAALIQRAMPAPVTSYAMGRTRDER